MTLQSLLDDFVQHNVDTACGLLETSGRFLYRLPETHTRMANMAEVSVIPVCAIGTSFTCSSQ